jgi:hypothetical protein
MRIRRAFKRFGLCCFTKVLDFLSFDNIAQHHFFHEQFQNNAFLPLIFWPFAKSKPESLRTCNTSAHLYAAALGLGRCEMCPHRRYCVQACSPTPLTPCTQPALNRAARPPPRRLAHPAVRHAHRSTSCCAAHTRPAAEAPVAEAQACKHGGRASRPRFVGRTAHAAHSHRVVAPAQPSLQQAAPVQAAPPLPFSHV